MRNPAQIPQALYEQMSHTPGFLEFAADVGGMAALASTPGWEDASGRKLEPGAKPIGLAQWGSAMMVAALIGQAEPKAPWPLPGIDPRGLVTLTWRIADNAELLLELHAGHVGMAYRWTSVRDGMPSRHQASDPQEVIRSLRAVMVGARPQ